MGWGRDIYKLARIVVKRPRDGYYLRWYYNGWHYWFFLPGEIALLTEGENYLTIGTRKVTMASGQVTESQIEALRTIMNTRHIALLTDKGWMSVRVDAGSVVVLKNQISGYEMSVVVTVGSRESYYTPIAAVPVIPPDTPDPDTCEIIIGGQVWMCANYAGEYPGSKVYNDDESNREIYGGLYSYAQVANPGFAPPGWHVPTVAEIEELFTYIGGLSGAGGILKEAGTTHWNSPNTGAVDTYGFSLLGAGSYWLGVFSNLYNWGYLWAIDPDPSINPVYYGKYDSADVVKLPLGIPTPGSEPYYSVRLIKDTAPVYDDWFLPSLDELNQMYLNLKAFGVGNFLNNVYWSSSEFILTQAYGQDFNTGVANPSGKGTVTTARACRSFIAPVGAYSLRDVGPGGGLIFYISGSTYYEAAPSSTEFNYAWSNVVGALIGSTGTAIGTGSGNTDDIIAQPGHVDSAAKLCKDLVI